MKAKYSSMLYKLARVIFEGIRALFDRGFPCLTSNFPVAEKATTWIKLTTNNDIVTRDENFMTNFPLFPVIYVYFLRL